MPRRLALLVALITFGALGVRPAPGLAAHGQVAMIEDGRIADDPTGIAAGFAKAGARQVRLFLLWSHLAPQPLSSQRPPHFDARDPAAYDDAAWAVWDRAVQAIQGAGMRVDLDIAAYEPLWAAGPGMPPGQLHLSWEPNPSEYGAVVHAVAERYSGNYDPVTHRLDPGNPDDLPRVDFWSIWNEPNYGPSLAPQGLMGNLAVDHSPEMYRQLLDAAWASLRQTGHGHDTVLFGELAPRGYPATGRIHFGVFNGMKPLQFLRALYCLDETYHPFTGRAARIRGCPSNAAGRRAFRHQHPGLFGASGFAIHPYSRWYPPNREPQNDPAYASLADIGQLTGALDRIQRLYGSRVRFPIWNTEYGYQTVPPKHPTHKFPWVSGATAASFLNQAEYISWRNPRIVSFMQYQLFDDPQPPSAANDWGGYASGLLSWNGRPKPTYDAWRLPVWLPATRGRPGARFEVWGCARPAPLALQAGSADSAPVAIEFRPRAGRSFRTLTTVAVRDAHGYFDTRVAIPGSGMVRLRWTYPPDDPSLAAGTTVLSRSVAVTVR